MIIIDNNGYRTWESLNRIKYRINIMIETKCINKIDTIFKKGSWIRNDILEIILKNKMQGFNKLIVTKMTIRGEDELMKFLEDTKQKLNN